MPAPTTSGGLALSDLRITYGGMVHSRLEPISGMLLSRTSWWLYYQIGS